MADRLAGRLLRQIRKLVDTPAECDPTDAQLVRQFASHRDEAAFAALVRRHGRMVLGVCRRVLGHEQDAEDAFQATFLVLARKAGSIRRTESVAGWLHGVARRTALKAKQSAARRRAREKQAVNPPRGEAFAEVAWRELQAVLDEEVSALPEKYRVPFVLCCLEGHSKAEAARQLGWKEGTVSSRLAQARERLRRRLARRGMTLSAVLSAAALAPDAAAAVPAALAVAAIRGAALLAAGQPAAGVVSEQVAALAEGVIKALFAARLRTAALLVLLLGLATTGAGALGHRAAAVRPDAPPGPSAGGAGRPAEGQDRAAVDRLGDPLPPGAAARLGSLRFRHDELVSDLAFSPDGTTVVSASWDKTVRLWDAVSGKEVCRLEGHRGSVTAVAFTHDGKTLISGCDDAKVRFWDLATGREVRILEGDRAASSVDLSPDGRTLAVAEGFGKTTRLWDLETGRPIRRLGGHEHWVKEARFLPDGKTLVSAGGDGVICVWDVATGKELRRLVGHGNSVDTIAIAPDGKTLASGGRDNTVRLWEVATGKELRRWDCEPISSLTFSPDGLLLAGCCTDRRVHLWETASGKEVAKFGLGPAHSVFSAAFSADGKRLASVSNGYLVSVWDVATRTELLPIERHRGTVSALAFSPDGQTLASGGEDAVVRVWEPASGRVVHRLAGHDEHVDSVAFSPDGKVLASAAGDSTVRLWDAATGKAVRVLRGHEGGVMAVAFSPEGRLLASAGQDRTLRLWDAATGQEVRKLEGHIMPVFCVAFSPDGKLLASGALDRTIRFWEVATGKELRRIGEPVVGEGHGSMWGVYALAFSPDGKTLASTDGLLRMLHLWEAETGKKIWDSGTQEQGEGCGGRALAFSPDGRALATSDSQGRVQLWETATGQRRLRVTGHEAGVGAVAFSPDGRTLASGSGDTTILVWELVNLIHGGRPPAANLKPPELESLWADLASDDAAKAYQAVGRLACAPEAPALFRGRLHPVSPARIAELVADLDNDRFTVRERASGELAALGRTAEPVLRQALAGRPSVEVRRRLERLLETSQEPNWSRHQLRAIEALGMAATPEARQVLERMAGGAPWAAETQEAQAALRRLARR